MERFHILMRLGTTTGIREGEVHRNIKASSPARACLVSGPGTSMFGCWYLAAGLGECSNMVRSASVTASDSGRFETLMVRLFADERPRPSDAGNNPRVDVGSRLLHTVFLHLLVCSLALA